MECIWKSCFPASLNRLVPYPICIHAVLHIGRPPADELTFEVRTDARQGNSMPTKSELNGIDAVSNSLLKSQWLIEVKCWIAIAESGTWMDFYE